MHLIYFDEAKNEDAYPVYHIGGVAIEETALAEIETRIRNLAIECFGTSDLTAQTEFHAADLYHRKKHFKNWPDFSQRISVLVELAKILTLEQVLLIDIRINCDKLFHNQAPNEIAFMFLCERANDLAAARRSLGMLIGDRESDRAAERHATTLSSYRAAGTDFAFGRQIQHLVDSVHFTHSHLSRYLQLADVYVWLKQFMSRNAGSQDRRHLEFLAEMKKAEISLFPAKYKTWPGA